MLVLTKAERFVGTKRSSFSYLTRELRLLGGKRRATSLLHPAEPGVQDGFMELLPLD